MDKDTAVLLVIDSKGRGAATVKVPSVTGQRVSDAQERLRTAGLESLVFVVPSPEPRGRVIAQNPKADSKLGRGKPVRLNVSAGTSGATTTTATTTVTTPTTSRTTTTSTTTTAARAVVPNVVGLDESTAVTRFQQAGLKASVVRVPSSEPEGTVVAQAKQPGTSLPRGSTVQINVSAG